ncbi:MAG: hypothetical protein CL402_06050 [Acidiferrobacteraceae bacterium]|nr:hypothetical protein [Acidiferrobacteraceae bacterium]
MSKDSEINIRNVIHSIKSKSYLQNAEGFVERLEQTRKIYDSYDLPDIEGKYLILNFWPFRTVLNFVFRAFRKLYVLHSVEQRKAFHLLMDEYKVLYFALRDLESKIQSEKLYDKERQLHYTNKRDA